MRSRQKSAFKDALLEHESLSKIFSTENPIFLRSNPCEIIIDFLKFIHSPPSPVIQTYEELAECAVKLLGNWALAEVQMLLLK